MLKPYLRRREPNAGPENQDAGPSTHTPAEVTLTPGEFEHLLLDTIDSVTQCEMLVTMRKAPHRWWSPPELALALALTESAARQELETLATRGLLDVRLVTDVHYRVAPASVALRQIVSELADARPARRREIRRLVRRGRAS